MKKTFRTFGIITVMAIIGFTITACDDGGGKGDPTVTKVTVSGENTIVERGSQAAFSATVAGTNSPGQGVDWSIDEADKHEETEIDADGELTVAADETRETLTVRATSKVDNTISGTLVILIIDEGHDFTVTGVTISPAAADVQKGGSRTFIAAVSGTNAPPQRVTWDIIGGSHAQTTISPFDIGDSTAGLLTISESETNAMITIRATSIANNAASGTATVTVKNSEGTGTGNLGNTLNISGQVSLLTGNYDGPPYKPFDGNLDVTDWGLGGSGSITGGNLNYSIGKPAGLETLDLKDMFFGGDYEVVASAPGNVQGAFLDLGKSSAGGYRGPNKESEETTNIDAIYQLTVSEIVEYLYVENDAIVFGIGKTSIEEGIEEGIPYTTTKTTNDFTLVLKAGWNAIYWKYEETEPRPDVISSSYSITRTESVSLADPALMWVLEHDEPPPPPEFPDSYTTLVEDAWADGDLIDENTADWYAISVVAGTTYHIWLNDVEGDGSMTGEATVFAWYSDGILIAARAYGYDNPAASFAAKSAETVYVRVTMFPSTNRPGTYAIVYNTTGDRPDTP